MLEIKYRGQLTDEQARSFLRYLHKRAVLISSGWEKALYLDTSIFPQIGDFATGFSRISIKQDQKGVTLRIKEGNPSDTKRIERQIKLRTKDLSHVLFLFHLLGVRQGYYRPCFRKVYQLECIKVSVKTKCAIGTHFEFELSNEAALQSEIVQALIKRFHLKFWNKEAYQQKINQGIRKFPPINIQDATFVND